MPTGIAGAGGFKLTSYGSDAWYSADLTADGSGTYDVTNVSFEEPLPGTGPESPIYVNTSYPAFANQSVLICEWFTATVGAYEIDSTGDPVRTSRRDFLIPSDFLPLGSTVDHLTGDFLFSDAFGTDQLVVVYAPSLGTNYCSVNPNSTGGPAIMSAAGSRSIADNDLTLTAETVPNQPFIMFHAPTQIEVPFGNGFLCAGGGITRLLPPGLASGSVATRVVDVSGFSPGARYFQCWFRDPAGGGAFFSTSDGYCITFVP